MPSAGRAALALAPASFKLELTLVQLFKPPYALRSQQTISDCKSIPLPYWPLCTLRGLTPKTSVRRDAQFDTRRITFVKVAPRVTDLATRNKVALPSTYPHKNDL
jgi:hypothetical protein